MSNHNTLYIAEPIFSVKLQKYDSEISFPPIKKIGITTDHPERREKELLGTISPVKISIVKAWDVTGAKNIESTLHDLLDNSRLDGEYFWDGNETLIDAVTDFLKIYHPDSKEIIITDMTDVKEASDEVHKKNSRRLYSELIPKLEEMGLKYTVGKKGKGVKLNLKKYVLRIASRTSGRYTLTIWSKTKTSEEALTDFVNSQELSSTSTEDSNRKARIPMAQLDDILISIKQYIKNKNA